MGASLLQELICQMQREMKHICSQSHDSILRDTKGDVTVKQFSWETVWDELHRNIPTLISVLVDLADGDVPLTCFIASMLLKKRLPKMCLVQRATSILLYGNGANTKIYNCLQPLMICLSHGGTMNLLDRLGKDYDVDVLSWSNSLLSQLEDPVDSTLVFNFEAEQEINHGYEEDAFDLVDLNADCGDDGTSSDTDENVEETIYEQADEQELDDLGSSRTDQGNATCFACHVLPWKGFKLVGDNVDKNIHPSFDRIYSHTLSLHYYHCFAVLDRIDLTGVSDSNSNRVIELSTLLPSTDDVILMKKYFSILISRVLVKQLPEYMSDAELVTWHIHHEKQFEMSRKSKVPLGVILQNENKVDGMCAIMDELHKYVPKVLKHQGSTKEEDRLYQVLAGGDQVTVVRARSAIGIRRTHDTNTEKLKGIVPVVEDWHARLTLLQAIFARLMKQNSGRQRGTLMHLKNLVRDTSVPNNDPKKMSKPPKIFYRKF
ncbi:PREDICTED: uncharacterized protein LOC109587103 isoform X2 [Amphimedon queenslandica]|uniref:DUF6589 domain-containing protein n=1 Tax=Amphimedon queenslandica TaxID=400682 RepID=A0AAN0JPE5_AMPQE|nr:PREDICTED: uncharacterized protein LOC109587103 isoform X2 [Amphimedon queenslandica]|eukprot:XP_019858884.1 PREDICTED: uncharacterized protein LOC109587103 isoform X2 [Amphimedon queenslandica]